MSLKTLLNKKAESAGNDVVSNDGSSRQSDTGENSLWRKIFKKEFYTKKKIAVISIILVAVIVTSIVLGSKGKEDAAAQTYTETQAQKMDITETIEQSGVIEPYERYEITSLVKGEIITAPFEEGDFVNEGDTLYQIDDEDAQLNIEKTLNNIEKSQMSLDQTNKDISKLNIYANATGKLTDFNMKVGDTINGGVVGTIVNTDNLTVDIPFAVNDFNKISVGNSVTITSALYMTSISGTVTHKYDATAGTGSDGSVLKNVEIEIKNPGALAEGTTFAAAVSTASGTVYSAGSGVIDGGSSTSLDAEVGGTVSYIAVKEGDYVKKGQLIAKLSSDSLSNTRKSNELNLKDSKLSLKSSQKSLDDYNITAPISGTIITKNSKAGDKIDNSNSQTVMMVVADMSKMKFTIAVDELDITDIKLGQTAEVDADALPDDTYEATVTSIAGEGTSTGDGVTTYTVELTVDEPGNLRPGMNVNANILINSAKDVIGIPEDALMSVKGSKATVMVKTDDSKKKKQDDKSAETNNSEKGKPQENGAENADKPNGTESKQGGSAMPQGDSQKNSGGNGGPSAKNALPEGCEVRNVEVGISDGTNIEVVSGLSEGETIVYIPKTASSSDNMFMMGGMMGGPGGGPGGGSGRGPGGGGGQNRGGGAPGGNQ